MTKKLDRPLRIFNVPWHVAHQAELYKLPNTEWYLCANSVRKWGKMRQLPANVFWVPHYEPGKYDMAVLHIDQQCVDPKLGKARLYRELNEEVTDIPKIVINHGTPYWPEQHTTEFLVMKMKLLLEGNHMVVNSDRALEMWGQLGLSSRAIIHGMEASQWVDLPKEPRVITMLSPGGLDAYYNRRLLSATKDMLKQRGISHVHITVDTPTMPQAEYAEFIGRSLVYFNPTLESPMPRSRTEAMLSGCAIVTLANHGAEKFITQGVNGFHVPDNPEVCADLMQALIEKNYAYALAVGKAGRQTALELFSLQRFHAQWADLIESVLNIDIRP